MQPLIHIELYFPLADLHPHGIWLGKPFTNLLFKMATNDALASAVVSNVASYLQAVAMNTGSDADYYVIWFWFVDFEAELSAAG